MPILDANIFRFNDFIAEAEAYVNNSWKVTTSGANSFPWGRWKSPFHRFPKNRDFLRVSSSAILLQPILFRCCWLLPSNFYGCHFFCCSPTLRHLFSYACRSLWFYQLTEFPKEQWFGRYRQSNLTSLITFFCRMIKAIMKRRDLSTNYRLMCLPFSRVVETVILKRLEDFSNR